MKQELIAKMKAFEAADPDDPRDNFRISFIDSMRDSNPLASCLWIDEDGEIAREEFLTNEEAIVEMEKHDIAFFIPKEWHNTSGCDWIWIEEDEDEDSPTFGEELWCCEGISSDEDGNTTARFYLMEKMWDCILDYEDEWNYEAYSRVLPWVEDDYIIKGGAE